LQVPPEQIVPVQHGVVAHDCPKSAHPGLPPASLDPPASVDPPPSPLVPPSLGGGGGGAGGAHVPASAPTGITHWIPEQQSAFDVHAPLEGMHATPEHVRSPLPFGTHGLPSQQSFAVVHEVPVWRQALVPASAPPEYARHRGTPSLSSWQSALFGVCPSQQSARAADDGHV
jgi:hypothetical protein